MKRRLENYIELIGGVNTTRMDRDHAEKFIEYYDIEAFDSDFNHTNGFVDDSTFINSERISERIQDRVVEEGDVVINSSLMLATIVSKENSGKVLSLNYIKVKFKGSRLDKRYFLYLFNENFEVQKAKSIGAQGIAIQRITTKTIMDIEVPILPIETQRKIGKAYSMSLRLQSDLERKKELIKEATKTVLEERIEEYNEREDLGKK